MAVTKLDGTAPLRSDPSVKAGSANASPAGGGKACGGTDSPRVTVTIKQAPANHHASPQVSVDLPPGVRHFADGVNHEMKRGG